MPPHDQNTVPSNNALAALGGATAALVSSYFIAVLFAYTFRIPVPLAAYFGPFGEISTYNMAFSTTLKSVFVAWVFYGILGGFVLLPVLGAIAGVFASRKYTGSKNRRGMIALYSALAASIPIAVLSVLDFIIGPW